MSGTENVKIRFTPHYITFLSYHSCAQECAASDYLEVFLAPGYSAACKIRLPIRIETRICSNIILILCLIIYFLVDISKHGTVAARLAFGDHVDLGISQHSQRSMPNRIFNNYCISLRSRVVLYDRGFPAGDRRVGHRLNATRACHDTEELAGWQ